MNVLYDSEQNAIAPTQIQEKLAQIDRHLYLKYVKYPNPHDATGRDRTHHWALACEWGDNDKRRRMIQRGDMPEDAAFDILGYLPLDIDVDTCYDKLVTILVKQEKHPHVAARELLERVHFYNNDAQKKALAPTVELAEQIITDNVKTMFAEQGKGIPKVFQTDAQNKGR